MPPKMPPEYEQFRRKQIIEAAWQLFAEKGYRETTVRDLAEKLGLSTGVLYTYFKGKAEIVKALEERSFKRKSAFYKRLSEQTSVRETVASMVGEYGDRWESEEWRTAARANLNLTVESLRHEELRESVETLYRGSTERLVELVERGAARGEFAKDVDPEIYARFLSAVFLGLQLLLAVVDDERLGRSVRRMAPILTENIWAAPDATDAPA